MWTYEKKLKSTMQEIYGDDQELELNSRVSITNPDVKSQKKCRKLVEYMNSPYYELVMDMISLAQVIFILMRSL
jgi:hypothetical protein